MAAHFLIYQTEQGAADQLSEFFSQAEESQSLTSWSATRACIPKNLAFFYFAKPTGAIIAVARASSKPERRPKGEGWRQKRTHAWFCSFSPVWLLDHPLALPSGISDGTLLNWWKKRPWRTPKNLDAPVAEALWREIKAINPNLPDVFAESGWVNKVESATEPQQELFPEGGRDEINREMAQRNAALRKRAIAKYGLSCVVCGFNFGDTYGELGAGYIEMHHLKLLAGQGATESTLKDVTVVCANCHRILHRKAGEPMDYLQLKQKIKRRPKNR